MFRELALALPIRRSVMPANAAIAGFLAFCIRVAVGVHLVVRMAPLAMGNPGRSMGAVGNAVVLVDGAGAVREIAQPIVSRVAIQVPDLLFAVSDKGQHDETVYLESPGEFPVGGRQVDVEVPLGIGPRLHDPFGGSECSTSAGYLTRERSDVPEIGHFVTPLVPRNAVPILHSPILFGREFARV